MDYREMTAPCGVPCFECVAYKAKSNDAIKKRISEGIGLDYEKSECEGCRARKGIGFLGGKNKVFPEGVCSMLNEKGECYIYLCAEEKRIHNCGECDDFPCERLQPLADRADKIPHNMKVYNLLSIQKLGLEKWATEKAGQTMRDYNTKRFDQ